MGLSNPAEHVQANLTKSQEHNSVHSENQKVFQKEYQKDHEIPISNVVKNLLTRIGSLVFDMIGVSITALAIVVV
jgi:hypothetical protein